MYSDSEGTKRRLPILLLVVAAAFVVAAMQAHPKPSPTPEVVACKVMEAKVSRRFGVRLVIFHYRDAADRSRLGKLLREYDGSGVQFQANDGQWHQATILRLKTCFGRGLLLCPFSFAPVAEGKVFRLRFPQGSPPSSKTALQGQ